MNKLLYLSIVAIISFCPLVASTCYSNNTDVVCIKSTSREFISFAENLRKDIGTLYMFKPQMNAISKAMFNFPHLKTMYQLKIEKSNLYEIEDGAFHGFDSLEELYIYENSKNFSITMNMFEGARNLTRFMAFNSKLWRITPGCFIYTPNLAELILYNNDLNYLEAGTFIGLQNLYNFEISKGELNHIEPGAFFGLDKMLYFSLEMNELSYLEDNTFQGMETLERLNLQGNNLRSLNYVGFKGLTNLTYLDLMFTGITQVDMNELRRYMPKLETVLLT